MQKNFDVRTIREELTRELSRDFGKNRKIAVFGAGSSALWTGVAFELMGDDLAYFIDDTPSKHGTTFFGKTVINLEEAHELCKSYIILVCSDFKRNRQIMLNSLREDPIDGAICSTVIEYTYYKFSDKILSVFDMLYDDKSKEIYANMILARLGKAKIRPELISYNQYFELPVFAMSVYDEVYVDCGAFVGDTIETFLFAKWGWAQKIYAFEPMRSHLPALTARVERLNREWALPEGKIQIIHAGIGDKTYRIDQHEEGQIDQGMTPGQLSLLGGDVVETGGTQVYSIDDYFANQRITFLKADIQGYELKMLEGAENVIRRDRPKLAICLYHTMTDMFTLPLKIKEICPDYKFCVRQHELSIAETVLYAYIDDEEL